MLPRLRARPSGVRVLGGRRSRLLGALLSFPSARLALEPRPRCAHRTIVDIYVQAGQWLLDAERP